MQTSQPPRSSKRAPSSPFAKSNEFTPSRSSISQFPDLKKGPIFGSASANYNTMNCMQSPAFVNQWASPNSVMRKRFKSCHQVQRVPIAATKPPNPIGLLLRGSSASPWHNVMVFSVFVRHDSQHNRASPTVHEAQVTIPFASSRSRSRPPNTSSVYESKDPRAQSRSSRTPTKQHQRSPELHLEEFHSAKPSEDRIPPAIASLQPSNLQLLQRAGWLPALCYDKGCWLHPSFPQLLQRVDW